MDNFNKGRKHPNMRNREASTHARGKDSIRKSSRGNRLSKNNRKTLKPALKLGQTRRKKRRRRKTTSGHPDRQTQKSHKHNSYSHLLRLRLIWKNFRDFLLLWIINEILASGRIHYILHYLLYKNIPVIIIYRCDGSHDNGLIFTINVNILLFILIILLILLILIRMIAILKGEQRQLMRRTQQNN